MKKAFPKILAITTALVMLLGAVPFAVSGNTEVADDLIALGAGASVVDPATRTVANGKVTEKVKVSVSPEGYVQFNKLLKGDFSIIIESKDGSDFSATPVQVQLTTDASAAADINPTDTQKAVTWYFYPSAGAGGTGRYHAGFGNSVFDDCQYSGCWSMGEGLQLNLTKQADTSIAVKFGSNAAEYADSSKLNTQPLSNLANYDGGVYLRIRSPWNDNVYIVTVTYDEETEAPEEPEVKDNVIVETVANGALAVDKTVAVEGDEVIVTVTPDAGYQLKAGSLRVNGESFSKRVNKGVDETTCNQFVFTMTDVTATVTAEFIPVSEANLTILGAAYNGQDLRFVSRAYRAKGDVALKAAGQLLMRADCDLADGIITDGEKAANIEALLDRAVSGTTGQHMVKHIPTTVLNDRCIDYIDFAVRIEGAGADQYKDREYVCISYAEYEDGTIEYSAACIRSYSDIA